MSYRILILPEVYNEIDEAATYYAEQFTGGEDNFLSALEATLERIERMPSRGSNRHDTDADVRGLRVEAAQKSRAYAKKFPYVLIYKTYEASATVVVYQLWPAESNLTIRNAPPPS